MKKDGLNDDVIYRAVELFKPFYLIAKNDLNIEFESSIEVSEEFAQSLRKFEKKLQQGTTKLLKRIHLLCVAKALDEGSDL